MDTSNTQISLSGLTTPLSFAQARHLLDRCTFGSTRADIDNYTGKTVSEALTLLLQSEAMPTPPISTDSRDIEVAVGETWVNTADNSIYYNYRLSSLRNWWIGTMVTQAVTLREKMTLF